VVNFLLISVFLSNYIAKFFTAMLNGILSTG